MDEAAVPVPDEHNIGRAFRHLIEEVVAGLGLTPRALFRSLARLIDHETQRFH